MRQHIHATGAWTVRQIAALAGIATLGLGAIVGSGGGAVPGYPPCGPPLCSVGPVLPAAGVTLQAPYVTAQVGTAASFTAVVSGISAPSYGWQRSNDGGTSYADMPGATGSSLTLAAVNLADDGARFRVTVAGGALGSFSAVGQLAVSASPGTAYEDGEFEPADWVRQPAVGPAPAPAVHLAERIPAGGNPGAYWHMQIQPPLGAASARVGYLSTSARYDPRLSGAVYVIDYAEDCNSVQASTGVFTEAWLLLEQGGRQYVGNARGESAACSLVGWHAMRSQGSLRAQDFVRVDGPACAVGESCPDFSASALPMRFGMARQSYATPGFTVFHGIDNWRVTVWRR